jgi:hypothetical protein
MYCSDVAVTGAHDLYAAVMGACADRRIRWLERDLRWVYIPGSHGCIGSMGDSTFHGHLNGNGWQGCCIMVQCLRWAHSSLTSFGSQREGKAYLVSAPMMHHHE